MWYCKFQPTQSQGVSKQQNVRLKLCELRFKFRKTCRFRYDYLLSQIISQQCAQWANSTIAARRHHFERSCFIALCSTSRL